VGAEKENSVDLYFNFQLGEERRYGGFKAEAGRGGSTLNLLCAVMRGSLLDRSPASFSNDSAKQPNRFLFSSAAASTSQTIISAPDRTASFDFYW